MPAGIRVTVELPNPSGCPVASLSARAGAIITDVSTSVAAGDSTDCVSEFLVDADAVPDDYEQDPVIAYADRHLYRVAHDADCPCVCLGEFDTPIDRYFADSGTLRLVFHAVDFERLQTVVGELRDRYPDADIQRLVRAPTDRTPRDSVFVDRGQLTDRQLDVLRTAYEMGYFDQPRAANATEVAEALDITQSTFSEHLLAAQSKLFADVLEEGS
jgi:predicted DNA binding protein